MKTVAVIPVHGRRPLLAITIRRLYRKNKVDHVICVGDDEEDKAVCKRAGASWVEFPNKPLGRKWNAGFLQAQKYNPDAVVYVGSSDWLSDNWLDVTLPYISEYDFVGKPDCNFYHYGKNPVLTHWTGYAMGSGREYEPIGIGRILSAAFLDKLEWQPFIDHLNESMDYCMIAKLSKAKGKLFLMNTIEIQSLSLSCDDWKNMHDAHTFAKLPNVYPITDPKFFLRTWFPESYEL